MHGPQRQTTGRYQVCEGIPSSNCSTATTNRRRQKYQQSCTTGRRDGIRPMGSRMRQVAPGSMSDKQSRESTNEAKDGLDRAKSQPAASMPQNKRGSHVVYKPHNGGATPSSTKSWPNYRPGPSNSSCLNGSSLEEGPPKGSVPCLDSLPDPIRALPSWKIIDDIFKPHFPKVFKVNYHHFE